LKKIKLTPRLDMIAQLVPRNSRVIDIGTDHGYLPIFLASEDNGDGSSVSLTQREKDDTEEPSPCIAMSLTQREKDDTKELSPCVAIIASDINEKPLAITKKNIIKYDCVNKIELRLGSGLKVLEYNEVDVIIIAGMGGILISEMIDEAHDILTDQNILILQPMQAQKELREYLIQSGFEIIKDLLVKEDNRIYEIIVAKEGKHIVKDEIYYEIGFHLEMNPKLLAIEFLKKKKVSVNKIISNLVDSSSSDAENKQSEYRRKLLKIEKILLKHNQ